MSPCARRATDVVQLVPDPSYQLRMDSGVAYWVHGAPAKSARWLTRYSDGRAPTRVWVSVSNASLDETVSAPPLMVNAVRTGGCSFAPWPDTRAGTQERSPAMKSTEALRRVDGGIRLEETHFPGRRSHSEARFAQEAAKNHSRLAC